MTYNYYHGSRALDFSSKDRLENIPRQINVMYPIRTVYAETRANHIADEIRCRDRRAVTFDDRLLKSGVLGVVENEEDINEIALIMAKLKYGADHVLFHDLGVGLNSALTCPNSGTEFYGVRNLIEQESGKIRETAVYMSYEGAVKLALGPLVDKNGRAITGAGPVVKEQKKRLKELIMEKRPAPRAAATINTPNGNFCVFSTPIRVGDVGQNGVFEIRIDRRFYPVQVDTKGNVKLKELHFHQVAGLSSVLSLGRYVLRQKSQLLKLPDTPEAHKAVLYMQAAGEMVRFAPDIVTEQKDGRVKFLFRRKATIKELRPQAVLHNGRVHYKEMSDFISKVGQIYRTAIDELGIIDHLHPSVLIPATVRGAEFPDTLSREAMYLKAEKVR